MAAFLIKSTNKENDELILRLAKIMRASVRVLDEETELDTLLIESIEKGMKSGKAPKQAVKKFFSRHGVRIH